MIDYSCFIINDYTNKEFEKLTERLDVYCPLDRVKLSFKHKNLMIQYYPNANKLKLVNSLHCFYNAEFGILKAPVNYNDFTLTNFQIVTEYLTKILIERPQENFILSTNFEVGLNIQLECVSPIEIINRYMSSTSTKLNAFETIDKYNSKGKPIQRVCNFSDYKLKFYDKSKQANLFEKNLLRYEIVYTELRKIKQALGLNKDKVISLKMLNDKNTWCLFFASLLKTYESIKKIPMLNEGMPIEDIPKIYEYCNEMMYSDFKRAMNINSFKKRRQKMKKVYDLYNQEPENYHNVIKNKLNKKFNQLVDIPQFQHL